MLRQGTRRLFSAQSAHAKLMAAIERKGHSVETAQQLDQLIDSDDQIRQHFQELDAALQRELAPLRHRAAAPAKDTTPRKVALTGAAGNIGYAALFRIAAGELLGSNVPIDLRLLDVPGTEKALEGVEMELRDCAFPLLSSITTTTKAEEAFDNVDVALLVGAKPRGKGMTRGDLLKDNGAIFKAQGQALNAAANRDTLRAVVVGNPANTNAWIASQFAPDLSPTQFSALTRLDHNRGVAQLSQKLDVPVTDIERFAIWGNHSSTQVPDVSHVQVGDKWGKDVLPAKWIKDTFTPAVQERGAAIIAARGASSAASAANAAIEHINHWVNGTDGLWTSMGVWSDGSYGAEPGVYYSYPVVCSDGAYTIVQNVPIDKQTAAAMEASNQELIKERDEVASALGIKVETFKSHFTSYKKKFEKDGKLPHFFPPSLEGGKKK